MPRLPWTDHPDADVRALLDAAFRQARLRSPQRPAGGFPGRVLPQLEGYRSWLQGSLAQSGLAQQLLDWAQALPQRPASLPDIYPALPVWLRWLERLRQPRRPRAIVRHVAYYLEWYAAPQHPLRPDLSLLRKIGPVGCYYCLHWPVVIGILIAMALLQVLLTVAGIITGIVLLLAAFFNLTDLLVLPLILGSGSPRQRINRVELYYYLNDNLGRGAKAGVA
jgi:hypothetical protein